MILTINASSPFFADIQRNYSLDCHVWLISRCPCRDCICGTAGTDNFSDSHHSNVDDLEIRNI